MAKECKTLDELLEAVAGLVADPKAKENYDLGRTNYFELIPDDGVLPNLRHGIRKWRLLGKSEDSRPKVSLMVDRRWLTIKLSDGEFVRVQDFQCVKKYHPVDILRGIFE